MDRKKRKEEKKKIDDKGIKVERTMNENKIGKKMRLEMGRRKGLKYIDELDLGVFLVVVLNQFHAKIFRIPHFV